MFGPIPKVETIGDAYMAVTNLVEPDPHHAATMVRFALRAQEEAAKVPRPDTDDGSMLSLRIGEGSGVGGGKLIEEVLNAEGRGRPGRLRPVRAPGTPGAPGNAV